MNSARDSFNPSQQISVRDIPKFQFGINNEELKSCIKQLNYNNKTLQKNLHRLKKQVQTKTSQSQITEALVFINSLIEIDPGLSKLLKTKQTKQQQLGSNPINSSSSQLGRKVNQISQSVSIIFNAIKNVEKRVNDVEFNLKNSLNQKASVLQQQIDENNTKMSNDFFSTNQKIQLAIAEFGDKLRQVQTKTLWQISDTKNKLETCVNQQYVKDANKQLQSKMLTKIKEQSIKQGAVDPQRVQKIQQSIVKNQKYMMNQFTQTNFKIQSLKQHIEESLLSKKENGEQKVQFQKRFGILNTNLGDVIRRVRNNQGQILQGKQRNNKLQLFQQSTQKQLQRMNQILKNLKIGDDFQKMLEKMDPHKICLLDQAVHDLQIQQQRISKTLDLARKEIDRVRSKTQFVNIITPNSGASKFSKEDVQQIVHQYFVSNMFAKKIQSLESQLLQFKSYPDMINDTNKRIARMQKQTDTHNLVYELKGLQQYVKKEVLIVNNRITSVEAFLNDDKKRRPTSAMQSNASEKRLGSSLSYKKLTPVNCISCYQNPMVTPERRSSMSKRH